uniref:Uncharacterized protein n=1 Tax=Magallana gigas TaxID=29159 RepID=A0A8W8P2K6_MAGGI
MNYIFKTEPSESIIITKNLEVGQELLDRAELIANPPSAVTIPIKKAKTSPVKTLVSIQGRVVSTTIQEKEPPSSSLEGTVVGYEVGDNCFTVLFTIGEDFQTFKIVLDILVEFLECTDEEVEYTLQQNLPFSCRQQVKDNSVESITN